PADRAGRRRPVLLHEGGPLPGPLLRLALKARDAPGLRVHVEPILDVADTADAAHACEKLRDLVRKDRTLERDDAVADMDLYRCRVRHDASERGPDPILEDDVVGRARFEDRPDRCRRADRAITQIPPDDPDAVS